MKTILRCIILALVALALSGCTYGHYQGVTYLSVLQKKALDVETDEKGNVKRIHLDTNSDPAIELARSVESLSGKIATMGVKP